MWEVMDENKRQELMINDRDYDYLIMNNHDVGGDDSNWNQICMMHSLLRSTCSVDMHLGNTSSCACANWKSQHQHAQIYHILTLGHETKCATLPNFFISIQPNPLAIQSCHVKIIHSVELQSKPKAHRSIWPSVVAMWMLLKQARLHENVR